MRKFLLVALIAIAVGLLSMVNREEKKSLLPAIREVEALYTQHILSLDSFLREYPSHFYTTPYNIRQQKYMELAYYFKKAAGGMIYFNPELYYKKFIGPFQFELNDKRKGFFKVLPINWLFTGPIGNEPDSSLMAYSKEDSINSYHFIVEAVGVYRDALKELKYESHFANMDASSLFDFLRVEIFRISSLDIANSDFIVEDAGMPSLRGSVDAWIIYMNALMTQLSAKETLLHQQWIKLAKGMRTAFDMNSAFKTFDRVGFIKNQLIPASLLLSDVQQKLGVARKQKWAALRQNARHIYDKDIFNPDYFAPNKNAYYTAARAKLGELLFFDPILSDNNERACASCHKPEKAFTDGEPKATAFERSKLLARNTPTVINSAFQKNQFWDLRATSLEDQLDSVVNNVDELHSSFDRVIDRINSSPEYLNLFYAAFPATKKNGIKREDVKNAIGVYERTVNGLNSRFDQYMQGDVNKMTASEVNGFNLYMGKARCGTCHFAPLFNGALPPFYELTDHHSLGVPIKDSMEKFVIDPDAGLYKRTNNDFVKFSFKTPTVRNSALTAPYMHNGVYKTLEQVVNFYDHAAGIKFIRDFRPDMKGLPFFTIIPIELKLTDSEKKDLVAFLHALNDVSASRTPKALPELKGKYSKINKRKIGGDY